MTDHFEDQVTGLAQNLQGVQSFYDDNSDALSADTIDCILDELTDPRTLEACDFGILIARWMERADHNDKQGLLQFLSDQKVALLYPAS